MRPRRIGVGGSLTIERANEKATLGNIRGRLA